MSSSLLRLALAWSLALLLVACAGNKTRPGKPAQPVPPPVYEPLDGPPTIPFDVDSIPEPVPQIEPRSRYGNTSPYVVLGKRYTVMDNARGYVERGVASWYGTKFHGRLTSNREPYDMFAFTAAHKSLPLPTYVRVTNLDNGRSLIVRVNDRGPFLHGRLIDLSYAAAVRLGVHLSGTAPVEVRAITPDAPGLQESRDYLQVGAFGERDNARQLARRLRDEGLEPVRLVRVNREGRTIYRVRIGPYADLSEMAADEDRLRALGMTAVRVHKH
ncbi:MAG: septal ring lytic transglycosylase RlpA family protein [Xanthomonadales bacterium]|nr:septal ring lytic transglycosylase RlpA family protein [Xanthomonadales bacterium]MCB1635511.1 septal ring lytic transglycosylase RlpA family protein [Xanthomonadales bacterium]